MTDKRCFVVLTSTACVLAWVVVLLGAYTRLKQAGLGCPDWPGCYGHWLVPSQDQLIHKLNQHFPNHPVHPSKAWKEMVHRYAAATLALCIGMLAWGVWRGYWLLPKSLIMVPASLPFLVIAQAVLGMWTVTWRLLPLVVMGHLLVGMTILWLLWYLLLAGLDRQGSPQLASGKMRYAVLGAMGVLMGQIILGGWTSANYAALVCPDFPTCHGHWLPRADWVHGFQLLLPIGPNYQGGLLTEQARMAIQMAHRYWAGVTALYLSLLAGWLWIDYHGPLFKSLAAGLLMLVLTQLGLGYLNVAQLLRPVTIPVSHNAVASGLMMILITIYVKLYSVSSRSSYD